MQKRIRWLDTIWYYILYYPKSPGLPIQIKIIYILCWVCLKKKKPKQRVRFLGTNRINGLNAPTPAKFYCYDWVGVFNIYMDNMYVRSRCITQLKRFVVVMEQLALHLNFKWPSQMSCDLRLIFSILTKIK